MTDGDGPTDGQLISAEWVWDVPYIQLSMYVRVYYYCYYYYHYLVLSLLVYRVVAMMVLLEFIS